MKTLIHTIAYVAVAALLFVSNSFAASDFLLEIDGVKGECKGKHIKLTEQPDGSFTAENIPAGTYEISYKAKARKTGYSAEPITETVSFSFFCIVSPRDHASGLPTGKRSAVQSPRDAASGQATGKRTHKPIRITKEWDASTPQMVVGTIVVGDVDDDGLPDDAAQGDPVHGVDVKLGTKSSSSRPAPTGYDLTLAKKI